MNNSRDMAATIVSALVGGVAGYLFFTERGRSVRRRIEPALEDFSCDLVSLRNTVQEAAGIASESWKLLNDTLGEAEMAPARYPGGRTASFWGHP